MIGGRLTMRAHVERNQESGTDNWNSPAAPTFAPIGAPLPCFVWSNQTRKLVDGGKTAVIEDMWALFGLDAGIRAGDQISTVTNRRGIELIPGRLTIEGEVQIKHTHLEVALRRIA